MSKELQGLPSTIGRYQVRSLLGTGGLGRVVLGFDPVLNREVALKLVEPTAVDEESLAELRYMFHREARATAALRSPSIVEVYDYSGPDAELMYMACELIEGPTLRTVLEDRGAQSPAIAAALGYELASALATAHAQGIVHRDIKPENIFWLDSGRVVLGDFGIAKAFTGSAKLGNTLQFGATNVYGSPAYMSPEQLEGGVVGPASDLHALGAVLYEVLTGRQAFDGPSLDKILEAVARNSRPVLAGATKAPRALTGLVESLLSRAADDRPADAETVTRALRDALDALDVTDPRVVLREFGATPPGPVGEPVEEEEPTELFEMDKPSGIRVQQGSSAVSRAASRGPFIFAMVGIGLVMAAGFFILSGLGALPDSGEIFPGPKPAEDGSDPSHVDEGVDVFILLRFSGRASVWVDGREMGSWNGQVRFALPPGPHSFELRFPGGTVKREVLLVKGTQPVFEFEAPAADGPVAEESPTP